jgi:amino acid transporter
VLLGYFKLRASRPEMERPFVMPGHPWLPAITIALYLGILAVLIGTQPELALGAGAMLGAILVAGLITTRRPAAPAGVRVEPAPEP